MASINIDQVTDAGSATPANSEETSGLPTEVLELPIFAGILNGAPAAVWTPTGDKSVEATTAVKFGKQLNDAGMFFLRDDKEKIDLFYNAQFISPQLVKEAQKKGKLKEISQPLAETVAAFNGTAPAAGPVGAAPMAAAGMPSSVPVDSPLNTQRVSNLSPGGPTSGPQPGSGRVLNGILTPTV